MIAENEVRMKYESTRAACPELHMPPWDRLSKAEREMHREVYMEAVKHSTLLSNAYATGGVVPMSA